MAVGYASAILGEAECRLVRPATCQLLPKATYKETPEKTGHRLPGVSTAVDCYLPSGSSRAPEGKKMKGYRGNRPLVLPTLPATDRPRGSRRVSPTAVSQQQPLGRAQTPCMLPWHFSSAVGFRLASQLSGTPLV